LSSSPFFSKMLCRVALALWIVSAGLLGWFFFQGATTPSADDRTVVHLAPIECKFILTERRELLQAVHGVVTGLSPPDQSQGQAQAAVAARSAGMKMAVDDNHSLMLKLPLPMKQLGMSVHRDFDELGNAINAGTISQDVLQRLSTITTGCLACHEMYQIKGG
jgi:hypothetical protein